MNKNQGKSPKVITQRITKFVKNADGTVRAVPATVKRTIWV